MLCAVLLFNFAAPVFAEESEDTVIEVTIDNFDVIAYAQDVYAALDRDSRLVFDYEISNDADLLAFHKRCVDPSFQDFALDVPPQLDAAVFAIGRNPLSTLYARLALLGLPIAVLYSLKALGISMTLALADGALPVGDIATLFVGLGTAIIFAVYWNQIASKWSGIVSAFQAAFSSVSATVTSAFQKLLTQIKYNLTITPSVTIQGKRITVNAVDYLCNTLAKEAGNISSGPYYPAILVNGNVYIDLAHPLTTSVAKLFAIPNRSDLGIWAITASYARGLCGGANAIWHNTHSAAEGYFPHYHHSTYQRFHCWYLG